MKGTRIIFGVCGGLAEYFGVDAVIIRLAFVIFTILEWPGILLYIILAIIVPEAEKEDMTKKQTIDEKVEEFGKELAAERSKRSMWLGAILICVCSVPAGPIVWSIFYFFKLSIRNNQT